MARIDFPGKKVGFRQVKSVWVDGWQCGGGVFCTKIHRVTTSRGTADCWTRRQIIAGSGTMMHGQVAVHLRAENQVNATQAAGEWRRTSESCKFQSLFSNVGRN